MATITSAQTGIWSDPATWVGGAVPDLTVDDAVIASGHAVVILPSTYIVLVDGHMLNVESGAQLVVVGGLEVFYYGSLYVDGELDIISGAYVSAYDDGNVDINSGAMATIDGWFDFYFYAYLNLYGEIIVESDGHLSADYDGYIYVSGGMLTVYGHMDLYEYGYMDLDSGYLGVESGGEAVIAGYLMCYYSAIYVYGELTVDSYGYIEAVYSSEISCESPGLVTVDGYLLVADDGSCRVYGPMTLSRSAGFDAWYYGYLEVNSGVVDDFGYLYIHYDAFLYVGGEIRVYKDIYISGQMYGGGKIIMFRREGQIKDGDGNSLFKLDQAYGHGQKAIA